MWWGEDKVQSTYVNLRTRVRMENRKTSNLSPETRLLAILHLV